ncbi:MAG: hypothetical protein U0105_20675 [Candidatus Obscuribacterales bacterium]
MQLTPESFRLRQHLAGKSRHLQTLLGEFQATSDLCIERYIQCVCQLLYFHVQGGLRDEQLVCRMREVKVFGKRSKGSQGRKINI